jgi:putative OPT family oligopeptide transporter
VTTPNHFPSETELTVRAVATGAGLGAVLSLCNIYSGLKIGWGFNMSVTAALLGFGLWRGLQIVGTRSFGKLENNINQTAASAGASISSAGLVSAIPALTLMTGRTFGWAELATWTFLISVTGVLVGVALRRQLIEVDKLPFANGIASAETLNRMYESGREAMSKVVALLGAGVLAAALKGVVHFAQVKNLALPGALAVGARRATLMNFTFAFDPSPLMIAVGALGSLRAGISMMTGAILAWGVIAPMAVANGWAEVPAAQLDDGSVAWFGPVVKWMLWPGVAMMVTASLTSVAFSWRSIVRTFTGGRVGGGADEPATESVKVDGVSRRSFGIFFAFVLVAVSIGQVVLFGITWWAAILAVLLTFVLAAVAGRVSGETAITPIGPMGKVTQLVFGVLVPGNPTANLMSANVTGGAAAQCGDLLHDLKAGALLGASPRKQTIAQTFGVLGGALAGCAAYLVLIPNPREQIGTDEWPGPAVMTWKAVAEVFAQGFDAVPTYAMEAMAIGGGLGIVLAILEKVLPPKVRNFVPSPAAFGLAFVVQAWYAISFCIGAVLAVVLRRVAKGWSERYLTPLASGVIAGESLMGVAIAVYNMVTGGGGGGH